MKVFLNVSFLRKWGGRVFWGLLDQALFSGTNFVVSFLLARWLTETDYGAFSIAFSVFLFFSGFPSALIWEPMTVYSTRYSELIDLYFGKQIWYQVLLTISFSIFGGVLSLFFSEALRQTFLITFFSLPLVLLLWFFRQVAYIKSQPHFAFYMSLSYSILYFCGLAVLRMTELLSPGFVFFVMAVASLGTSFFLGRLLSVKPIFGYVLEKKLLLENWSFGKYILLASVASSVSSLAFIPLLGIFVGIAEAGAFRAMQNLILPLQQTIVAMSLLMLPQLSKSMDLHGEKSTRRIINGLFLLSIVVIVVYMAFIWIMGDSIVTWLYHKAYFQSFTWMLIFLGCAFLFTAGAQILGIGMRAFKRPEVVLWAKGAAAFSMMAFGVLAIYLWKISGLVVAMLLSAIAEFLVLIWIYNRKKPI